MFKRSLNLRGLWLFIFLVLLLPGTSCDTKQKKAAPLSITVSAASDLMLAFEVLGHLYEKDTGNKVNFSFGATGQLAQQIEEGAPVDLFAAANESFIVDLEKKGLIIPDTRKIYAQGHLAIWTRPNSPFKPEGIGDLLNPKIRRIAIANPEHAPYGIAAREALVSTGLWDKLAGKLVYAENVRQTLQFAETGDVDVALVALSLSIGSDGRWMLIPQKMHNPLNQTLAVIKGAKNEAEARKFAEFINGPQGRTVMRQYGFSLPGEEIQE